MKEKHTPGPWYVQFMEPGDDESDFWVKSNHNNVVHYGTDILQDDYGDHNGYPREQRMADAMVIAEAPEMLFILREFCRRVEAGEVRSKMTYAAMKEILDRIDDK